MSETPEPGSFRAAAASAPAAATSRRLQVSVAELRIGAVLLVGLALLGLLVGLVWAHVAPRAVYTVVDLAQHLAQQNDVESEAQVGVDGWFALIGAGVGLVTGAVAWRWRATRGPFLMVVLAVSSLLGAVVAWRFGLWVGRHPTHAELIPIFARNGNTFKPAITMQAKGVLFFQPIGAVLAAVLSAGFTRRTDLGRDADRPAGEHPTVVASADPAQTVHPDIPSEG